MKKDSPTERSIALMHDRGYFTDITQRWIKWAKPKIVNGKKMTGTRKDLFGFGDIIAIKRGVPPILVQVTSFDHVRDHWLKMQQIDKLIWWLEFNRVELHGWATRRDRSAILKVVMDEDRKLILAPVQVWERGE